MERKTDDWMQSNIKALVDPQEPLLAAVKKWKLTWLGHATHHDSLSKTILQGILEGTMVGRGNAGWTESGHSCPHQKCQDSLLQK